LKREAASANPINAFCFQPVWGKLLHLVGVEPEKIPDGPVAWSDD
jgi:hypothetical protein